MMLATMLAFSAMTLAGPPETIRLWPGDAPGALGSAEKDIPTLTIYRPEKPCGTAVLICPGGGYGMLAQHEGRDYALFLNRFGIVGCVLKYRLGSDGYHHPSMLLDAQRGMRMIRAMASELKVDSTKIGVMGSSAGGHLASTLLTHYSTGNPGDSDPDLRQSSRPDFGILCYAVITMGPGTHEGSRNNLLGPNPPQSLIDDLSNEKRVTDNTPPCFIWSTADDGAVPVNNSLSFAQALVHARVPVEIHVYPHGEHGLGLGGPPDSAHLLPWTTELVRWLQENKWLPATQAAG